MHMSRVSAEVDPGRKVHARVPSPAAFGLAGALFVMAAAIVVPAATHWDVYVGFPPLFAQWRPRLGPGTLLAVPIAVLGVGYGGRLSHALPWSRLMVVSWATSLGWLASLALVDVRRGVVSYPDTNQFLQTARITDVSRTLPEFISRIPLGPDGWATHVAGHPPGALLFFVLLVRLGLGGNIVTGVIITLMASTIPVAVLSTVRVLRAEPAARLAAPFLVLAPAAIWEAVSADAVFACFAAWALAALARGAVHRSIAWSVASGLLLGACVMMSYGLPLLGFLAIAVLVAGRSYRPLLPAAAAALAVVAAFSAAGFSLWLAYPAIHQRYYAGIAGDRPATYWLWGNLAALCFSAGPALGAALACWFARVRHPTSRLGRAFDDRGVIAILGAGALCAIVAAEISLMSKAEVERIWLPFIPWLLLLCALLPARWRRPALALQVITALLVQHLLVTGW